jgi:hypothetical protein
LTVKRNGQASILRVGETAVIGPGVWHDWWNAGNRDARARVEITPGERFILMLETIWGVARLGHTNPFSAPSSDCSGRSLERTATAPPTADLAEGAGAKTRNDAPAAAQTGVDDKGHHQRSGIPRAAPCHRDGDEGEAHSAGASRERSATDSTRGSMRATPSLTSNDSCASQRGGRLAAPRGNRGREHESTRDRSAARRPGGEMATPPLMADREPQSWATSGSSDRC